METASVAGISGAKLLIFFDVPKYMSQNRLQHIK